MKYPPRLITKIRRAAANRHWTQKELAKEAGVTAATVSNLYRGNSVLPTTMGLVLEALDLHEPIYPDAVPKDGWEE